MLTLQQVKDKLDDVETELIYANQIIKDQGAYIDRLNDVIDTLEYSLYSATNLGEEGGGIGCCGVDIADTERDY